MVQLEPHPGPSSSFTQAAGAQSRKRRVVESPSGTPIAVKVNQKNQSSTSDTEIRKLLDSTLSKLLDMKLDADLDHSHLLTLGSMEKDLTELQDALGLTGGKPPIYRPCSTSTSSSSFVSSSSSSEEASSTDSTFLASGKITSRKKTSAKYSGR